MNVIRTCNVVALAGLCTALLGAGAPALGQTYSWLAWTQDDAATASVSQPGFGSASLHASANATVAVNWAIEFQNVPFTPADATGLGIYNPFLQAWSFDIDLAGIADTADAVIGLGDFGHNTATYTGYRLSAFDTLGNPMSLAGLTQLGSYTHRWPFLPSEPASNDHVALDLVSGDFEVTVVPGGDDIDSGIALLTLPSGVGRLRVASLGPSDIDIVNVLISPIPAPAPAALLGLGAMAAARRRRR